MYSPFTQMPDYYLHRRIPIQEPRRHNRVQVPAQIEMKLHARAEEMRAITVLRSWPDILLDCVSRMEIYGDVQLLYGSPEEVLVGYIKIHLLLSLGAL